MRLFDEIEQADAATQAPAPVEQRQAPQQRSTTPPARRPLDQMATQFNVPQGDLSQIIKILIPAMTNGMKRNVERDGIGSLIEALQRGQHGRYLDQPDLMEREEAKRDGESILGHIFGSKEVNQELAKRTAQRTGVDVSILEQMLPMVAKMTMGAMNKQGNRSGMLNNHPGQASSHSNQFNDSLKEMLDADGKDSLIDDLLGFLK